MLEQPPLLRIRRGFARAEPELVAAFARAESAQVADALAATTLGGGGTLDAGIQALAVRPGTLGSRRS